MRISTVTLNTTTPIFGIMTTPWIFICPSSRGIGHALTRHLLRTTSLPILATARPHSDPREVKASLLDSLPSPDDIAGRLSIVHLDVTDEATMEAAAERAHELFPSKKYHLRLACAIPGILGVEKKPEQIDAEKSLKMFQVNSVGTLLLMKHFDNFLPKQATEMAPSPSSDKIQLPQHATWLSMSARVGSITDNALGGWYSYRASKAAVSSITKSHDNYLKGRNGDKSMAVSYHPGTVKTDLSGGYWESQERKTSAGLFEPEEAVEKMVDVISKLTLEQRGKCWDWKGEEVPP